MKYLRRNLLSFILVFALVLGVSPIAVFSDEAITIKQVKLGNVFMENEEVEFQIQSSYQEFNWYVADFWSKKVASGTEKLENGIKLLTVKNLSNGYFTLHLSVTDLNGSKIEKSTPFCIISNFDSGSIKDSPFGFSTHYSRPTKGWTVESMDLVQKSGAKNIRDAVRWEYVETTKGTYTFPDYMDAYMFKARDLKLNPLMTLALNNQLYDNFGTPYTEEGLQGFADYSKALMEHYGDFVKWGEVYNEYNKTGGHNNSPAACLPESYAKLIEKTYKTVKASNPNALITGPATAGIPIDWIEPLFKAGGLENLDFVTVHRYPKTPEGWEQDVYNLYDIIKKHNNGQLKPVWLSETGWSTSTVNGVAEDVQARYIVRNNIILLSIGVEKIFTYDFMNDGIDIANREHNFGVIRHQDDKLGAFTPKPSYVSYSVMARQLSKAKFAKKEEIASTIYSYVFNDSGEDIRAMWSTNVPSKNVAIQTTSPLTVSDFMGNEKIYYPFNGVVTLTLTEEPLYVKGAVQQITDQATLSLTTQMVVPEQNIPTFLTFTNPTDSAVTVSLIANGSTYDMLVPAKSQGVKSLIMCGKNSLGVPAEVMCYVKVDGNYIAGVKSKVITTAN